MLVLGIESSCDDTAAALWDTRRGLLSGRVASQDDLHSPYGGIVPELASRQHLRTLDRVVADVLEKGGVTLRDLDGIAVTTGPGLMGSLVVGISYAKSLALALGKPLIPVDHLDGHLHSVLLTESVAYPFLALLVSGGHSAFYRVESPDHAINLGGTQDDAIGEVFDKVAKLLGFGYPGGAIIEEHAKRGNPAAFAFPRPLADSGDLRMSFSGLKTAVAVMVDRLTREGGALTGQAIDDLCASFQTAAADTLALKTALALRTQHLARVVLVGGVAANQAIRQRLAAAMESAGASPTAFHAPPLAYCRDNAAMIARLAAVRMEQPGWQPRPMGEAVAYARH